MTDFLEVFPRLLKIHRHLVRQGNTEELYKLELEFLRIAHNINLLQEAVDKAIVSLDEMGDDISSREDEL